MARYVDKDGDEEFEVDEEPDAPDASDFDEEASEKDRTEDYDDAEGADGGYGPGKGYSRAEPESEREGWRFGRWVFLVFVVLGLMAVLVWVF